jgi:hypothetical protein
MFYNRSYNFDIKKFLEYLKENQYFFNDGHGNIDLTKEIIEIFTDKDDNLNLIFNIDFPYYFTSKVLGYFIEYNDYEPEGFQLIKNYFIIFKDN